MQAAPEAAASAALIRFGEAFGLAFQLKDVDMHEILEAAGFPLSRPEMSALFRQPGNRHYKPCGDQILRNLLKVLTLRFRSGT